MSKELDEKRATLEKLISGKDCFEKTMRENKKIFRELLPLDVIFELHKMGKLSDSDFLAYKNDYEALEYKVRTDPNVLAIVEKSIEDAKAEIKELEKIEKNADGQQRIQIAIGNAVLCIVGTIVGYFLFAVTFKLINYLIDLVALVPFLGVILYWPSDISLAKIVLPASTAVSVGALVCSKICGGAKLYSSFIALLYLSSMILWFAFNGFSLKILFSCSVFIVNALITFSLTRNNW